MVKKCFCTIVFFQSILSRKVESSCNNFLTSRKNTSVFFHLTKMLSRTRITLQEDVVRGGIKDFVDSSYLNNKRPKIPGGAWPVEMLRKKSMGDLQQIWFMLLRERNMLLTMKEHYSRHAEELGAWPAPSRLNLVEDSMENIKAVLRERDNKANDAATAMFNDRVARRIYNYPPGPQPAPGTNDPTSRVKLILNRHVHEDRLRELFGRFDSLDAAVADEATGTNNDKGIISIKIEPTADCLAAKLKAEQEFTNWWWAHEDVEQYSRWSEAASFFDHNVEVELAPGEFLGKTTSSTSNNNESAEGEQQQVQQAQQQFPAVELEARNIPVPSPLPAAAPAKDVLERIKSEARTYTEKQRIQLGYFPNFTSLPPAEPSKERPVHPDEILGPWQVVIVYRDRDGADYAKGLNISRIDGAEVLDFVATTQSDEPAAAHDIRYDEALNIEAAAFEKEKNWPHAPSWGEDYEKILKKDPALIVQHNWVNTIDYMEREAMLTGKNVWETPIPIDPTCGEQVHIPPNAKPPVVEFPEPDHLHTHI
jgi:large subunit ribosomal protein L47